MGLSTNWPIIAFAALVGACATVSYTMSSNPAAQSPFAPVVLGHDTRELAGHMPVHQAAPGHDHDLVPEGQATFDHERRHHGKPGADIQLISTPISAVPMNTATTLELHLQAQLNTGTLRIALETDPDLLQLSEQAEWVFDLEEGNRVTLPVTVMAVTPGEHLISLRAMTVDAAGRHSSRALAAAVRAGTADHTAMNYKVMKSGDGSANLRILSADEHIY